MFKGFKKNKKDDKTVDTEETVKGDTVEVVIE
jgi:hypothetical protein